MRDRIPRTVGVGLGAVAVLVLLAAGLGNLVTALVPADDEAAQFAAGHFVSLPIAIVLAMLFLRRAGWGRDVWREPPTPTLRPRRWWLVSIPVLLVALAASQMGEIPWSSRSAGFVAVVAVGVLMVGFTEELACRGILLVGVRGHHGELAALLVTSFAFAAAHIPSSLIQGVPPASIAFQVAALAATGSNYYWVRRVSGRLWVAIVVHAFSDGVLYLASGSAKSTTALTNDTLSSSSAFTAAAQGLLLVASLAGLVSAAREDRRNRVAPDSTGVDRDSSSSRS